MNVYIAYGFQGEHVLGVFADRADAVTALRDDALDLGESPGVVATIGTDEQDDGLDGFTIETHEVIGA